MDSSRALALRSLLHGQQVAALATLHKGEPAVSMVPYALLPKGQGFVIHVSQLATHTADMLADPAVALLVVAAPGSAPSPRELPRASVKGRAHPCAPDAPEYAEAREAYLSRFPQSEEMFSFADFSLYIVTVRSVRDAEQEAIRGVDPGCLTHAREIHLQHVGRSGYERMLTDIGITRNDVLNGQGGNDILYNSPGADRFVGGSGADEATGQGTRQGAGEGTCGEGRCEGRPGKEGSSEAGA